MRVKLHTLRCIAKTENDEDEIYCLVMASGAGSRGPSRIEVGSFDVGRELLLDSLLCDETNLASLKITLMESDADEPAHGSDDFIGEITVSADGSCRPGHGTLDEGFDPSKRYRQFSMTGSGAHYVAQFEVGT